MTRASHFPSPCLSFPSKPGQSWPCDLKQACFCVSGDLGVPVYHEGSDNHSSPAWTFFGSRRNSSPQSSPTSLVTHTSEAWQLCHLATCVNHSLVRQRGVSTGTRQAQAKRGAGGTVPRSRGVTPFTSSLWQRFALSV